MSSCLATGRQRASAAAVSCAALLAACNAERNLSSQPATDIAATVNREPVSLRHVDDRLRQSPRSKAEPADAAGREVLERLIDEELAVQKARQIKLDRDPRVLRAIDSARREVIARAYREKTADSASRPEADAIRHYYDANPALFSQRRIYTLQEIAVEADAAQIDALKARLPKASPEQLNAYLKTAKLRFVSNQAARAAEQLPMASLPQIAALRDGQSLLLPAPSGARLVTLLASRAAPVDEVAARPLIEQFLWNENKRRVVEADLKALRDAATIEYVGRTMEAGSDGGAAVSALLN